MATIRCSNCNRYIQDFDRQCLYCNTPNKQYKPRSYESVGSFGSFDSFGNSASHDFSSSTLTNSVPKKDFHETEPSCHVEEKSAMVKKKSATVEEKSTTVGLGTMASFFTVPMEDITESDPEPVLQQTRFTSVKENYREKLDNYRKANGYGEYSPSHKFSDEETYTSSHNKNYSSSDYSGRIDLTSRSHVRKSSKKKVKKNVTVKTVLLIIFLFYFGQFFFTVLLGIISILLGF